MDQTAWKTWQGEATARLASDACGVYIFRVADCPPIRRAIGESDVIYIGSATNLRARLIIHSQGRTSADSGRRICRLGRKYKLSVAWRLIENPEREEKELLAFYELDHYELPPCNRSRPEVEWEELLYLPEEVVIKALKQRSADSQKTND